VANPKSGSDCSVFITIFSNFYICPPYIPPKMSSCSPGARVPQVKYLWPSLCPPYLGFKPCQKAVSGLPIQSSRTRDQMTSRLKGQVEGPHQVEVNCEMGTVTPVQTRRIGIEEYFAEYVSDIVGCAKYVYRTKYRHCHPNGSRQ
jgi:hypothetical protein